MNGSIRCELAKVMIADRQRKAEHASTVAQAQAARRDASAAGDTATVASGTTIVGRVRTLLRIRTA
jgi:hypothetical protein